MTTETSEHAGTGNPNDDAALTKLEGLLNEEAGINYLQFADSFLEEFEIAPQFPDNVAALEKYKIITQLKEAGGEVFPEELEENVLNIANYALPGNVDELGRENIIGILAEGGKDELGCVASHLCIHAEPGTLKQAAESYRTLRQAYAFLPERDALTMDNDVAVRMIYLACNMAKQGKSLVITQTAEPELAGTTPARSAEQEQAL